MTSKVNLIKHSNKFFAVSIALVVIGIIFFFINGMQFDIDFTGGTVINAKLNSDFTEQDVLNLVKEVTDKTATVQKTGEDSKGVMISFSEISEEEVNKVKEKINEKYKTSVTNEDGSVTAQDVEINTKVVEATYGAEIRKNTIIAVLVALVLMVVYISIRFQKLGGMRSALSAIIGLVHNVLIVTAVYVIFKITINSAFVAAILTVIGYSINNTIVVYDRIRENRNDKETFKSSTLEELVDTTIGQILGRTINTTITSVATVAVLLGFAIYFGQTTLIEFTIPLIVGLLAGEYSSICISTPIWYKWENKK